MRIVAISDTHAQFDQVVNDLPDGDVLLHAGDITNVGEIKDLWNFAKQIRDIKSKYKDIIVIGGNHDFCLGNAQRLLSEKILFDVGVKYLHDSGIESCNLNFWGSPYQPEFCDWQFNLPRGNALAAKWKLIPENTNVLITHSPPYNILDAVHHQNVGCCDLAMRVKQLKELKLHVFGHIHPEYGQLIDGNTTFVNASLVNNWNQIVNSPIVLDL